MNYKLYQKAVALFSEAPEHFYCPAGRSKLLTQNEIDTRNNFTKNPDLKVTFKEMVFRKFYEISLLPNGDWQFAFKAAVYFLDRNTIKNGLLEEILMQLMNELKAYNAANGRRVFNL